MYTFLSVCMSVHHVHACAWGGRKRALDLLELELYIVWATVCVLGTKPCPLLEQLVFLTIVLSLAPCFVLEKKSHYISSVPGWLRTHWAARGGLTLQSAAIKGVHHHAQQEPVVRDIETKRCIPDAFVEALGLQQAASHLITLTKQGGHGKTVSI